MQITAVKTRRLEPPKDDLLRAFAEAVSAIEERSVIAVASKVVSIWQGRCLERGSVEKGTLIAAEAEQYLPRGAVKGWPAIRTKKYGVLGTSAGVDESNGGGYFVLLPEQPFETAREIRRWVQTEYGVSDVGVIITDSRSHPLRRGSTGVSLGFYGFKPLRDYRGTVDVFGKGLVSSQANVADGLAAAAVVAMGEGGESTPVAVISDPPVVFGEKPLHPTADHCSFFVEEKDDIFYPYYKDLPWERGIRDRF